MLSNLPFIIAEIGINHNGDLNIAKKLIDGAKSANCDAVKFQKRTIDIVYSKDELEKYRESPWGTTTRQQKEGLEFTIDQYNEINKYCKSIGIEWFFSAWDTNSQLLMQDFKCRFNKIASAMLGNKDLIKIIAKEKKYTFISTGMSTLAEIDKIVNIFNKEECEFELMHCNSTYPLENKDANLSTIKTLGQRYGCRIGYSGHEKGRIVSFAAAMLGATSIERHITLDRTMYGSDQASSIEIDELIKLVKDIRSIPSIMGYNSKTITESEKIVRKKLRYYEK
jgi:N-acetylneuraminate synthase